MQYPNFFPTITLFLVMTILSFIHFPSSSYADNEKYLNCSAPFDCAGMKGLNYPFWGSNRPNYCGHPAFELNCSNDAPHIKIRYMNYRILDINKVSRTLMVASEDYWNTVCPILHYYMFRNFTADDYMFINRIDFTFFDYDSATTNLTLYYACSGSFPYQPHTTWFNCSSSNISYGYGLGYGYDNYCLNSTIANLIGNSLDEKCRFKVIVPVLQSAAQTGSNLTEAALVEAIDGGFMLRWDADNSLCDGCQATGGQCGYITSTSEFTCFVSTTGKNLLFFLLHLLPICILKEKDETFFVSMDSLQFQTVQVNESQPSPYR